MFDLTVLAVDGRWVLEDDAEGTLGAFASQAEALAAAGECARIDDWPRTVLVQDQLGEWAEEVIAPPALH